MSTVWIGAAYTFGAIAITTMLVVGRWRSALIPVAATWPFAMVMLAATLIHSDRFFTEKAGYYLWLAIYLILPFALPAMFVLNRDKAPGRTDADLLLPFRLRGALAIAGCVVGLVGLFLVLKPTLLDQSWPWLLTPLMSRVIGGWLLFLATGGLATLVEPRYEAYRYYFPVAAVWFALLFVNSVVHLEDFDFGKTSAALFFVVVAAAVVGAVSIFFVMEQRLRSHRPSGS
jgi:hypothetical protein